MSSSYETYVTDIDSLIEVCKLIDESERNRLLKSNSLDEDDRFFYAYIYRHRNKKEQILKTLTKIKELGIEKVLFNENAMFNGKEYSLILDYWNYSPYTRIDYLDNMKAIPNYENNVIRYVSLDSNYLITVETSMDGIFDKGKEIKLNSLVFDSSKLPDSIDKKDLIKTITGLRKNEQERVQAIRNSVELSVSIDDLDEQYGLTSDTIECLEDITDKDKIVETLNIIGENIKKLKEFSLKHNEELTKKDPDITPGVLQREKRRRLSLARPMYQDFDN